MARAIALDLEFLDRKQDRYQKHIVARKKFDLYIMRQTVLTEMIKTLEKNVQQYLKTSILRMVQPDYIQT